VNRVLIALVSVLIAACSSSGEVPGETSDGGTTIDPGKGDQVSDAPDVQGEVGADLDRDILSTELLLDVTGRTGTARIRVAPSQSAAASFEAGGLKIEKVVVAGAPARFEVRGGQLDVEVPVQDEAVELLVTYTFTEHNEYDGYMSSGLSFLWPYFCSNLFPCKSAPAEGVQFSMSVTGVPAGKQAIYPTLIPGDAPSYMPAVAIGNYEYALLGTTQAGTKVGVWYQTGESAKAMAGTKYLAGIFDWFETTYGGYIFGKDVASVSASWGAGAYGGMEHHPYWHVARSAMGDGEVHAHEAAHGWFGNGIRIRCWEDFVLSEGTSTYLTARGFEAVAGAAEGAVIWSRYQDELQAAVSAGDTRAWPDKGCNTIDILHDPLWSSIPYMKGAYFYKAVADQVGVTVLDNVIAHFYGLHVGREAGMQDMLDLIKTETGFDPAPIAETWLRGLGIPP
jgi:hypothetical protein